MLTTLNDMYFYTNEKLLSGELSYLSDVIDYFNEAQLKICEKYPLEAPVYSFTIELNVNLLPTDCREIKKITVDGVEVIPEIWARNMIFDADLTGSTAKLYYYKNPTPLVYGTPEQVPDVEQKYLPTICKYAAQMYFLADDDSAMSEQYKIAFMEDILALGSPLAQYKKSNCISNIW